MLEGESASAYFRRLQEADIPDDPFFDQCDEPEWGVEGLQGEPEADMFEFEEEAQEYGFGCQVEEARGASVGAGEACVKQEAAPSVAFSLPEVLLDAFERLFRDAIDIGFYQADYSTKFGEAM